MPITFEAILTDAGAAKLANATISAIPINITNYKIGEDAAITLSPSLTNVVGVISHTGGIGDISFEIVDTNTSLIKITLQESVGPFEMGNIGLFTDDDTLIAISTFSEQLSKSPNAIGVVGNRYQFTIPISYTNLDQLINFSLLTGAISSWPWVETIADLPDPNLTTFQGYIIRNEPGVNRAILAFINENSGVYSWTLDYNVLHNGNSRVEIPTVNGNVETYINNTLRTTVNSDGLTLNLGGILNTNGSASNPSYGFSSSSQLGMFRNSSTSIGFSVGGTSKVVIGVTGLSIINSGRIFLPTANTPTTPSYTFDLDQDTGMFNPSSDILNFSTGGVSRLSISDTASTFVNDVIVSSRDLSVNNGDIDLTNGDITITSGDLVLTSGNVDINGTVNITTGRILNTSGGLGSPSYSFVSDTDTGVYNPSSNVLGFQVGGTQVGQFDANELRVFASRLRIENGTENNPSLAFVVNGATGLYSNTTTSLGITVATNTAMLFTQTGSTSTTYNESRSRFRNHSGTVGLPSYTFSSDNTSGMYYIGANNFGFSTNGVLRASISNNSFTINSGVILNTDGSASNPAYGFSSSAGLGVYRNSPTSIGISASNLPRVLIGTTGLEIQNFGRIFLPTSNTPDAPAYSFSSDPNTGMFNSAADTLSFSTGGVSRLSIDTTNISVQSGSRFRIDDGSTLLPGLSFNSDSDTGIRRYATNGMALVAGESDILLVRPSGLNLSTLGSATAPSFTFNSEVTGLFKTGSGGVGISTDGIERLSVSNTTTSISNDLNAEGNTTLRVKIVNGNSNVTLTAAMTNSIIYRSPEDSTTRTYTLTEGLPIGTVYRILNSGASNNVNINVSGSDSIISVTTTGALSTYSFTFRSYGTVVKVDSNRWLAYRYDS